MATIESSFEEDVEVAINDKTTGRKTAFADFNLQSFTDNYVSLTIFQVYDVNVRLLVVYQTYD